METAHWGRVLLSCVHLLRSAILQITSSFMAFHLSEILQSPSQKNRKIKLALRHAHLSLLSFCSGPARELGVVSLLTFWMVFRGNGKALLILRGSKKGRGREEAEWDSYSVNLFFLKKFEGIGKWKLRRMKKLAKVRYLCYHWAFIPGKMIYKTMQ